MRRSRSRRPARATRLGLLAGLALAIVCGTAASAAQDEPCPPFQATSTPVGAPPPRAAGSSNYGIAPSARALPQADESAGEIVQLPPALSAEDLEAFAGEALLILPRGPDGLVPDDFELSPRARIAASFWSPVLCATVVHVVGPPPSSATDLVPKVPATAALVPHHRYHTVATEVRPLTPEAAAQAVGPDPYVKLQYGLERTGVLDGRPDLAGAGVRVAILDSTPEITHRELRHVRVSPLAGGPPPAPALHGTLVAGVIAAAEHNAFGIVGLAPAADVVAVPVCAPVSATGTVDECRMVDLLRGFDEAWRLDVRVVNLALVGPADRVLERAVDRLRDLGILLVAAAGNDGRTAPRYPAAYPSVLGVAAADPNGKRWPRSNHGSWVALEAPGTEILSTTPGNAFAFGDGTSLAAAHVAGLLAVAVAAADTPEAARFALLEAARGGATPISASYVPPKPPVPTRPMPRLCSVIPLLGRACPQPAPSLAP